MPDVPTQTDLPHKRAFITGRFWLVIGFSTLLACGCKDSNQQSSVSKADESQKSSESTRNVCVIASGDTQGWLIPCGCTSNQSGGLPRRATYVQSQQENFETLIIDVGGATDGAAPYQTERFRAILKGEVAMGYAAHNLGANELLIGPASLRELQKSTGIAFLSANAKAAGGAAIGDAVFIHQNAASRQSVAVIGVVSPEYATNEITVSDPEAAVLSTIAGLPETIDRVVVLAYLPLEELNTLASRLPEVDVLIGGPTGQALAPQKSGQTIFMSATNKGKFLAQVEFQERRSDDAAKIIEISSDFEEHPIQTDNLLAFRSFLSERDFTATESGFAKNILQTSVQHASIAGTKSCQECHTETNEHWDSTGHAHAWQTLVNDGAHVDSYCQQCHTTGFGQPEGFLSARRTKDIVDVGCESCHGPSSAHVKDSSVKTPYDAAGYCRSCHDEENSPLFEYDSYWEKVKHGQ